ncbi:galactose mutarotase [Parabacteroides sp. BX2]|jgi:aldose 1-epimerase|uniref:Aldose 1-epimerase n=1 Tax=Parabacteroides segnis TaxID=2763058 RepID=A0ABR7DZJ8_9BACT|nr:MULTISPECIES: aldose epimerase family protein [Parabacteroides]MBC5642950.1 galactose mutarotase [Parabacteroides segnis]MCM0713101.1 galactose mutarotase [Parabacteroides sp. TA-V-105]
MKRLCMAVMAMCLLLSCGEKREEATLSGLMKSDFVSEVEGKPTALYVLKNKKGAEACITNYGGRLVSVMVPDKNGKMTDVVLGYDNIGQYVQSDGNYGALIGRYGNRINQGKFTLDDVEYTLPQNNGAHCLHGGPQGYHARMWDAKQLNDQALELTYLSKDGEAGFPGNLDIKVTYTLTDDNAVGIKYEATTDKKTVVNLTNHSYFNLSGVPGSDVLDQLVMINADNYTPVDSTLIPVGISPVDGTPLDLRTPVAIGKQINDPFQQLVFGRGYDLNWVLNTNGDKNVLAAKAYSPTSGIALEVYTNEPGIQFYTGNFMDGKDTGKHGVLYPHRGALCLETQHYPDSPNHPDFPSVVLNPGEKYLSECIYKFTVE